MGTQLTATVGSAAFGALLGAAGGHLIDEPVPGQPKNNTGAIAGAIIGTLVGGFLGYEGSSPAAAVAGAGGIPRGVGNHFKQGYVPPPPQGGAPGYPPRPPAFEAGALDPFPIPGWDCPNGYVWNEQLRQCVQYASTIDPFKQGLSGQPQRRVARGGAVNSQLSPARGVGNHFKQGYVPPPPSGVGAVQFAKAATPPPAPAPRPHWHCDMTQNPPHCWWE